MKKYIIFGLGFSLLLSSSVYATISDEALKFVPGGKVLTMKGDEVKVQTTGGSVVEVEFDQAGKFDEASGKSVENDVLVPQNGLLTLKDAIAAIKKAGKNPIGEWSMDNSLIRGWYYEFEGYEEGKKMDYILDAKSGKLLEAKIDD